MKQILTHALILIAFLVLFYVTLRLAITHALRTVRKEEAREEAAAYVEDEWDPVAREKRESFMEKNKDRIKFYGEL